jgi:hypothetical protein
MVLCYRAVMSASEPELPWTPVLAKVTSCRRTVDTWFVRESVPTDGLLYERARFVVYFSYSVAAKEYSGRYTAYSPREVGETFEILFDPEHPECNTGSDKEIKIWLKVAAVGGGIVITLLLSRLFSGSN